MLSKYPIMPHQVRNDALLFEGVGTYHRFVTHSSQEIPKRVQQITGVESRINIVGKVFNAVQEILLSIGREVFG